MDTAEDVCETNGAKSMKKKKQTFFPSSVCSLEKIQRPHVVLSLRVETETLPNSKSNLQPQIKKLESCVKT